MPERRTARRYRLALPVVVREPSPPKGESSTGITRDISSRGIYFTTNQNIPYGSTIDLTLTLLAEATGGAPVWVWAYGRVIRVEKAATADAEQGVAAVIERYDLVQSKPSAA